MNITITAQNADNQKRKINTRKQLKVNGGTIRFRRLDGPAARAKGMDYGATLSSMLGSADAVRVKGIWVAETQYGRNNNELAQILNNMEAKWLVKNPAAVALGRLGGQATSQAKTRAVNDPRAAGSCLQQRHALNKPNLERKNER